ncbi:MAG: hypothetical protein A2173_07160 [Planctomycetes bacterium RBG_13_44_8b]|nr:MAG: hypothetical protein A2173_07160 [Planctomycetes bacterium RBG_13_44_8b]
MVYDEKTNLLNKLQNLLEMQIKLAHQGNATNKDSELLNEKAGEFVEKIVEDRILELPEFQNQREHLYRLYQQLSLIIADQKDDTAKKLNQIRKTRKTVAAYRSNI